MKAGVVVHRAIAPSTVQDKQYSAGSFVVKSAQFVVGVVTTPFGCYAQRMHDARGVTGEEPGPPPDQAAWWEEFAAAARRPLATRLRYAFIHTYKPVLDDARYRSFETTADYRTWCKAALPDWLGYH